MSSVTTSTPIKFQRPRTAQDDVLLDYRERRVIEVLEREAAKRQDHAEQSSAGNSAGVRIRAWEKLHQLRMPSTPSHPRACRWSRWPTCGSASASGSRVPGSICHPSWFARSSKPR